MAEDPAVIQRRWEQRAKQVSFGKDTDGYRNYLRLVPREYRDPTQPEEYPTTPDVTVVSSKRAWDHNLREWRRNLHAWDPAHRTTAQLLYVHSPYYLNPDPVHSCCP